MLNPTESDVWKSHVHQSKIYIVMLCSQMEALLIAQQKFRMRHLYAAAQAYCTKRWQLFGNTIEQDVFHSRTVTPTTLGSLDSKFQSRMQLLQLPTRCHSSPLLQISQLSQLQVFTQCCISALGIYVSLQTSLRSILAMAR